MTFYITVGLGGLFLLTTFVSIIVIVVQTKRLNRLQMGDRNYQNIENGNNEGDEGDHDHQVLEGEDPNRNNMHENNDRPIPRPRPVVSVSLYAEHSLHTIFITCIPRSR